MLVTGLLQSFAEFPSDVFTPRPTKAFSQEEFSKNKFILPHPGFNLELGSRSTEASSVDLNLEYTNEHDEYYYIENFTCNPAQLTEPKLLKAEDFLPHIHFIGTLAGDDVIVSTKLDAEDGGHRGMLRGRTGDKIFWCPENAKSKKLSSKQLLSFLEQKYPGFKLTFQTDCVDLSKMMVSFDLMMTIQRYKFGVVYCQAGQSEEEIFANETVSPEFEQFLSLLGEKFEVLGWQGYKGDLDVKHGSTGKYAVYRKWEHLEIIFEVAPYITACRRKAIIGNTITTIVFQQSGCFDPSAIVSQVLHSFCVVQPVNVNGAVKYRYATTASQSLKLDRIGTAMK